MCLGYLPFYIRDLSIRGSMGGSWNQCPEDTEGRTYVLTFWWEHILLLLYYLFFHLYPLLY